MLKNEYTTLNKMLSVNDISAATAEYIICYVLRVLQFQTICEILREDKEKYVRWLSLSRRILQPTEFARRITNELCRCQLDEDSYELMGGWLLGFFRKKDHRAYYPQKFREELLVQQQCRCAICGERIDLEAELDHVIPWKYVGDELDDNLQLLCFKCNRSKKAAPLYQLQMLLQKGHNWRVC